MLHHFAVGIHAEDVDTGPVVALGPLLVTVEDDEVALGNHSLRSRVSGMPFLPQSFVW